MYLKDFKASNVEDSQEGGALAFGLVQSFVHSKQDPAEEALEYGFSQGFSGEVSLSGRDTKHPDIRVNRSAMRSSKLLSFPCVSVVPALWSGPSVPSLCPP